MGDKWMRILFFAAALYDGVLGAAFLLAGDRIFEMYEVQPPNHPGYIQFSALLLLVFAVLFLRIAQDPVKNRELILFGCGLKISYCATVFFHQLSDGIPSMWLPWAWADLLFLLLFVVAWKRLGASPRKTA